jgi:hypothetical protein
MMRKIRWYSAIMVLVLSAVLVLSNAQQTQANPSRTKQQRQAPPVDCNLEVFKPIRLDHTIRADGAMYCRGALGQELTVQLQQLIGEQWVTLDKQTQINATSLEAFAPCSTREQAFYRTYVTGRYKTASGWHFFPGHAEAETLLSCT